MFWLYVYLLLRLRWKSTVGWSTNWLWIFGSVSVFQLHYMCGVSVCVSVCLHLNIANIFIIFTICLFVHFENVLRFWIYTICICVMCIGWWWQGECYAHSSPLHTLNTPCAPFWTFQMWVEYQFYAKRNLQYFRWMLTRPEDTIGSVFGHTNIHKY